MYATHRAHLVRLGLLTPHFRKPSSRSAPPPEFDYDTATLKAANHDITRLGQLLLRYIEVEAGVHGCGGS